MTWTHFWDMNSGGRQKLEWKHIYIEAPEEEAKAIFFNRFGRNPERITCTCCGEDYSIRENPTLKQATGYQRNCRHLKTPKREDGRYKNDDPVIKNNYYLEEGEEPPEGYEVEEPMFSHGEYVPLEKYVDRSNVLVIRAEEIEDEEKEADIPEEGFVWEGGR